MKISRAAFVRRLYWILAGYVASTGLLNVLSHSIFGTRLMRNIAVPAMYSWAGVIPLVLIAIWVINRNVRPVHSKRQRWIMRLTWLPLWSLWLYSSFAGLLYVAVNEPWPFNLHHGPDTEYAQDGFTNHAGFPAPPAVTQIYFTSLGVMERHDKLDFKVTDTNVVMRLIENQKLVEADSMEPGHYGMLDANCLAKKRNKNPRLQCYFRDDGRAHWALRYDPLTESVHYEFISP